MFINHFTTDENKILWDENYSRYFCLQTRQFVNMAMCPCGHLKLFKLNYPCLALENRMKEICGACSVEHETCCGNFFTGSFLQSKTGKKDVLCAQCMGPSPKSKTHESSNLTEKDILPLMETLVADEKLPYQKVFDQLIEIGWKVNTPISGSSYAVHLIAKAGRVDLMDFIFNLGANIDVVDHYTPLHYACENGDLEMAKKLIELGANINITTECSRWQDSENGNDEDDIYRGMNETALHIAIDGGNVDLIKFLLENGADVHALDGDQISPLFKTLRPSCNSDLEIVQLLIKHGADIAAVCESGSNAVHMACLNEDPRYFEYFMTFTPDLNVKTNDGYNMLHFAVQSGNFVVVKMLLDLGVDINAATNCLDTALSISMNTNNFEMVQYLLEKGAIFINSPKTRDSCSDFIVYLIKQVMKNGEDLSHDLIKSYIDFIEYLFNNCDDFSVPTEYHQSLYKIISANKSLFDRISNLLDPTKEGPLLHALCAANNCELLMEYIDRNYNVNSLNCSGESPLFYASNPKIIQILVTKGINIDHKTSRGMTAFLRACEVGNVTLFESLLDICDFNAVCNNGRNALHYAIKSSDVSIIKRLISKGFDLNRSDKNGWTPVNYLIDEYLIQTKLFGDVDKKFLEIIKVFKEAGAEFSYKEEFNINMSRCSPVIEAYKACMNKTKSETK